MYVHDIKLTAKRAMLVRIRPACKQHVRAHCTCVKCWDEPMHDRLFSYVNGNATEEDKVETDDKQESHSAAAFATKGGPD